MVVGSDVLNYDNKTIIAKGTKLSQTLITRLELYGILSIYVEDLPKNAPEENSSEENEPSHFEKIRESV